MARRSARDEKKELFAYKHQEEVYKKIINDQLEYAYRQKTWRPPGDSDDSDDSEGPKKKLSASRSNFESEAGSSIKGSTTGKGESKPVMVNDGLGNTNMSMCLTDLNTIRQKLFEKVGLAVPKKKKPKRTKRGKSGDDN